MSFMFLYVFLGLVALLLLSIPILSPILTTFALEIVILVFLALISLWLLSPVLLMIGCGVVFSVLCVIDYIRSKKIERHRVINRNRYNNGFEVVFIRAGMSESELNRVWGTNASLANLSAETTKSFIRAYAPELTTADVFITSAQNNAIQTGDVFCGKNIPKHREEKIFNEIYFGTAEGKSMDEFAPSESFVDFLIKNNGDNPSKRARAALVYLQNLINEMNKTPEIYPNRKIIVITHEKLIEALVAEIKGWNDISDVPSVNKFDAVSLPFVKSENENNLSVFAPSINSLSYIHINTISDISPYVEYSKIVKNNKWRKAACLKC